MQLNYTMVFAGNTTISATFYRDKLGIPLRFRSPGWTEFAPGSATLALHQADKLNGKGPRTPGQCRPRFAGSDLQEIHQRVVLHAVHCVQEPKSVFGALVAQYADPTRWCSRSAKRERGGDSMLPPAPAAA